MSNVSADYSELTCLAKYIMNMIDEIENLTAVLNNRYKQLGMSWNDSNYAALGRIIYDNNKALATIKKNLLYCAKTVLQFASDLEMYESINFINTDNSGIGTSQILDKPIQEPVADISEIEDWVGDINPNYTTDPFDPYYSNCGSCAFAVESRLNGDNDSVATLENLKTDEKMEEATGKKCEYMSVGEIEELLKSMGAGSHLIVGIDRRRTWFGVPRAGHWFNAYYDGNKIYTIDGQVGRVFEWPHDYGHVSRWCALV